MYNIIQRDTYTRCANTSFPRFFDGIQYLSLPNESVLSRINQEEQMFAEGAEVASTRRRRRDRCFAPNRKSPIDWRINYRTIKYLSVGNSIALIGVDARSSVRFNRRAQAHIAAREIRARGTRCLNCIASHWCKMHKHYVSRILSRLPLYRMSLKYSGRLKYFADVSREQIGADFSATEIWFQPSFLTLNIKYSGDRIANVA